MHRKRNIFEYLDQCKTPDLEFQLVEYHEHHHEITGLPSYDDDLQKHDISAYTGFKTDAHQDEGDRQGMSSFHFTLFGRTADGLSVCLVVKFFPVMTIRLHTTKTGKALEDDQRAFLAFLTRSRKTYRAHEFLMASPTDGFYADPSSPEPAFLKVPFIQLCFVSMMDLWSVRKLIMNQRDFFEDGKKKTK